MTTTVWLDGKSLTVSKMLAVSPERNDNLSDDIWFNFALFLADTMLVRVRSQLFFQTARKE